MLFAPRSLALHNAASTFDAAWIHDAYKAAGGSLRVSDDAYDVDTILELLK